MIVISGALVLVALILLVIGLIDPSLGFVYASIGVSLASFGFLVVGILQRRKEELPGAVEVTTALLPSGGSQVEASDGFSTLPPVVRKATGTAAPVAGKVFVVAGRPRYHVEGCRYLTGKEADRVNVADARDEGFTACGVCKPDENLAAPLLPAGLPTAGTAAPDTTTTDTTTTDTTDTTDTTTTDTTTDTATPVSEMPAVASNVRTATKPPVKPAAAQAMAAAKAPAKAAAKAPVKAPVKAAAVKAPPAAAKVPAKKAPAPVKRGMVVVIPDRGKFHTPDCRYVRGAEETLELTKAAATKQGYAACGVCTP